MLTARPLAVLTAGLTFAVAGCVVMPRYQEAEPRYSLPIVKIQSNAVLIVYLEPVFKGKRFDEVVCDNVSGATWSPKESKEIGFTQNYAEVVAKTLPAIAVETSLPYNIGAARVASGDTSWFDRVKIDSRIMIPLGAYISRDIEQLLRASMPEAKVCFDVDCVATSKASNPTAKVATVQFTKMAVSEDKPNRLTLLAEGTLSTQDLGGQPKRANLKYAIVDRHIASEGYRHSDFLRVMDKMANEISSAIAEQIFTNAL